MASLFTKIFNGEIPGKFIYQDELCAAIFDIKPEAPKHFLVIPRKEITSLATASQEDRDILGHLLLVAGQIAREQGFADNGYRVVINTGDDGGQTVSHLHVHVLAGRPLGWPPG